MRGCKIFSVLLQTIFVWVCVGFGGGGGGGGGWACLNCLVEAVLMRHKNLFGA